MSKLGQLFRWNKKVEIKDGNTVLDTVYIRLVGDNDYQNARNVALRYSKELRVKLRNPETMDHQTNLGDLDSLTKDDLVMGITVGEITDYRDEALVNIPEKEAPQLPDNASLEQQEEHETLLIELRDARVQSIMEFMEKKSDEKKVELDALDSMDDLRELYTHSMINIKCGEEFTRVFREYQVFSGTFKDKGLKALAFDSFEEFSDCSPQLKTVLLSEYISLEISGEELKN